MFNPFTLLMVFSVASWEGGGGGMAGADPGFEKRRWRRGFGVSAPGFVGPI